jgi:hypothetical protein
VVFLLPYTSIAEQEKMERQAAIEHFNVQWERLEGASISGLQAIGG